MNWVNVQNIKIMFIVSVLVDFSVNKRLNKFEFSYHISENSVEYVDGLLRVIGLTDDGVQIGAKSVLFQIPFDITSKIMPLLHWKSNLTQYCGTGSSLFIQFMSKRDLSRPFIEVCGSDSCQLECRIFDTRKKIFVNRRNGFRMIPMKVGLSTKHILNGNDLVVAVPSNNNQAFIALHSNRSFFNNLKNHIITPHLSFNNGKVNFLQIQPFRNKIYFIFTETASEMINYHQTFHNIVRSKVIRTRLGRICENDKGVQLSELLFTSFIKATLVCQAKHSKQFIDYTHAVAASAAFGRFGMFLILFRSSDLITKDFLHSSVFCLYNFSNIEKQLEESKVAVMRNIDSSKYWSLKMKTHNLSTCQNSFDYTSLNTEWMVAKQLHPNEEPIVIKINKTLGNPTAFEVINTIPITLIMPDNKTFHFEIDMIYIGTDNGYIARNVLLDKRLIQQFKDKNFPQQFYTEPILKFDHSLQVFEGNVTVNDIKINIHTKSIIVVSSSMVKRIPLEFCSTDCWSCNNNFDPICQWDPKRKTCEKIPFIKQSHAVQIYNCQSDQASRSTNILKDKNEDTFWLIFSFVTFSCIFIVVLTVSIAIRYSPRSFSRSSRINTPTIYKMIHSTCSKKSIRIRSDVQNSTDSFRSDVNSTLQQQLKVTLPKTSSKSFNSAKDSVIFKNRFYLNIIKPKYFDNKSKQFKHKGTQFLSTHFYSISKENSNLRNWKSCSTIF